MDKVKVTAVTYINTKPFLYGLFKSGLNKNIDLQLDIPSVCASKLKSGAVDLGLVPVAIIPELRRSQIISDYCIGAIGAVETVCIYSDRPIEQLTHLYLDHHSRTSVELTKILLRKYWHISPKLIPAKAGYIDRIGGTIGGLVIGDRTIGLDQQFEYVYDLGEVWEKLTGLPFVFAAWVSTKPLPSDFVAAFNAALAQGLNAIPELIYLLPDSASGFDLRRYLQQNISYNLDAAKREALNLFMQEMKYGRQVELRPELVV